MPARFLLALFVLFAAAVQAGQAGDPTPSATAPAASEEIAERIGSLIQQLGDENFETREAASKALASLGNRARAALTAATKNDDAEIASRAKALLDGLPKLTHTIVDALGQPIPLASVTITFERKPPLPGVLARVGELPPMVAGSSEEDGRIGVPEVPEGDLRLWVAVEHAEYGLARAEVDTIGKTTTLQLPLVRRGTEAHRRALTGQVVKAEGSPIGGAVVDCSDIRTPGEGLIEGQFPRGSAVTDDEGRFTYYLPPSAQRQTERGVLIPANSRFGIQITKPGDEGFFPWSGRYSNLAPVRIQVPRAGRMHRFRFEAVGGGWISDPKELQEVRVQYDGMQDGERLLIDLGNEAVVSGRKLVAGKYSAERFANGQRVEYLPVAVTDGSDEMRSFSLPHAVTYRGQATHGVTGKPVNGALVVGWNSTSRNNLALLTPDDWVMLRDTPSNPPGDHPAIRRLREFYGVQGLVRADREGRFELVRQPDQDFYGILAFDQDMVPFKVSVGSLKPNDKHEIEVGEFPLFPAAKLVVRPVFEGERLAVAPRWYLAETGQPEWFERFQKLSRSSEREFEYVHWLVMNESQPVYVPADLRLNVRFETPYDDKWDSATLADIQIEPATTKEGGDLTFPANLPVAVRVVDPTDKPLEGVPVRQKYIDDNAWSVAHNTDKDGLAHFHAPAKTGGEFWVSDLPGNNEVRTAKNLYGKFTLGEKPLDEPVVTITITQAQAELLLGPNQ